RREIAGGADRTLRRDLRQYVGVEERDQPLDDDGTYAGIAAREARDLERDHKTHDFIGEKLADARGMGEHEIALQMLQLVVRDARLRELSETGVDSIQHTPRGKRVFKCRARPRNAFP